jgi:ribosomal protein L11 methyltransferase
LKKYYNIRISILEELQEIAVAALTDFPFEGIVQENDTIIITVNEDNYSENTANEISELISEYDIKFEIIEVESLNDKNWNEEFEAKVPAIHVNDRIGIAPEWKIGELTEEIKIKINPKMSFGTGEHSTTKLCCQLLDGLVDNSSYWVDAGTGTGILAILAVKLGAREVYAFDNYEWSYENSLENVKLNEVDKQVKVDLADIDLIEIPKADGIVANIFTNLILSSMPKFYKSLEDSKGDLVCSGILKYDKELIVAKAKDVGFRLIKDVTEDEWIAFHFKAE